MSDRIPGSSWSNPIWHGKWRIYVGEPGVHRSLSYAFSHDDYDGAPDANDNRCGHAESIEAAKAEIDDMEDEGGLRPVGDFLPDIAAMDPFRRTFAEPVESETDPTAVIESAA